MRQTSKRARRSRALMIVIFVLLAALVIWGLTALLGRLLHYGTNATVSAKDHEQLTPIEPSAVDKAEEIPEIHMIRPAFIWTAASCAMKATP